MSAITLTISGARAIVADGRLVAGESADVSVAGAIPAKLYLVGPDREVVAYCDSFVAGQASGTGVLNLATDKIAAIVADMAAGDAVPLSCLVEDSSGAIVGYGFVQLVAAPMPEALEPVDIDPYVRESVLRALLADYLTKAEAAETYATKSEIPSVPVTSVNGKAGAVVLYGTDILRAAESEFTLTQLIDYAIDALNGVAHLSDLRYDLGPTITASAPLADRTCNRVAPAADNTDPVALAFPGSVAGKARDFFALVTNTAGNAGSISFTAPSGATIYGDGFGTAVPPGETWLYLVTEIAANTFYTRAQKMEVPA